jgi:hypothetical protein
MSTAYSTNAIINMMPQTHDANGFVRPDTLRRQAIPMRTGHHRQPDGSVVRVDIEMGRCIVRSGPLATHMCTTRGTS